MLCRASDDSVLLKKRPVGVEPTLTGLQPVAGPSGSSLRVSFIAELDVRLHRFSPACGLTPQKQFLAGKVRLYSRARRALDRHSVGLQ